MTDAEKLTEASERIKEIIIEYDLAATVVLCNSSEHLQLIRVDPSFSCASLKNDILGVYIDVADYPRNSEGYQKRLNVTFSMLVALAQHAAENAHNFQKLITLLKKYQIPLS